MSSRSLVDSVRCSGGHGTQKVNLFHRILRETQVLENNRPTHACAQKKILERYLSKHHLVQFRLGMFLLSNSKIEQTAKISFALKLAARCTTLSRGSSSCFCMTAV